MSAPRTRSWQEMRDWQVGLLERSTGESLETWNQRIRAEAPGDEPALRAHLDGRGVHGYAHMPLVHETFGYPDFLTQSADELIDAQYADRQHLRPIHNALMLRLPELGDVVVQARKTYTSLVAPRRTFAVVAPTTHGRVDLGLRWADAPAHPRLLPVGSRLGGQMTVRVGLEKVDDLDEELFGWLRRVYDVHS